MVEYVFERAHEARSQGNDTETLDVYKNVDRSKQPSFDYRADGSWRISPLELQAEFRAYLSRLGYRPAQLTQQQLKALVETFMAERNCIKTAETEQILRDPS